MIQTMIDLSATIGVNALLVGSVLAAAALCVLDDRAYRRRRNQRRADHLARVGILCDMAMPALPGVEREQWRRDRWAGKIAGLVPRSVAW